jgi:hypothetical protein
MQIWLNEAIDDIESNQDRFSRVGSTGEGPQKSAIFSRSFGLLLCSSGMETEIG